MIEVIYFDENINIGPNVSCIGCFDGVHKGHQELIKKTIELSNTLNVEPMLITFDPDPISIYGKGHLCLTTLKERIKLFEHFGIKKVLIIPFDKEVMKLSPIDFKKKILDKLNIKTLVCGFDFTYGYKGSGNADTLRDTNINLCVVPEFKYYGKKISSTRIRTELEKGNIDFVNRMLGYEFKK